MGFVCQTELVAPKATGWLYVCQLRTERDIQHPMQRVFHGPMRADGFAQGGRVVGAARQKVADLAFDLGERAVDAADALDRKRGAQSRPAAQGVEARRLRASEHAAADQASMRVVMSLPDAASLDAFSLAELREVVGRLVGEVHRLHSSNVALQARVDAQQVTITALRAENQALRGEVARLKGLPHRPPSRPSDMEQATQPGAVGKGEKRPKPPRGVKRDAQAITAERVLKVAVPAGSRFKGYEDILVRDLRLSAEVVRYRRERWVLALSQHRCHQRPFRVRRGL
jgi:hypothetical protein